MYLKMFDCGKFLYLYDYKKTPHVVVRKGKGLPAYSSKIYKSSLPVSNFRESSSPLKVESRRFDNLNRTAKKLSRLIVTNDPTPENTIFVTLTYAKNQLNIQESKKDFDLFIKKIKYTYGKNIRFISVLEFQTRGAIHYHALFWDLPFINLGNRGSRRLAQGELEQIWGFGFVKLKSVYGSSSLISNYLVKYFTKSISDPRLVGVRLWSASRNIIRPKEIILSDSVSTGGVIPTCSPIPLFHSAITSVYSGNIQFYIYKKQKILCNLKQEGLLAQPQLLQKLEKMESLSPTITQLFQQVPPFYAFALESRLKV
jgi:hypothetical protein